ncbi:hypothetical protein TruAng_008588 [Truncatella angustata]|nr:hypothetical protein TruAng_008588 [Truncatella angustata]
MAKKHQYVYEKLEQSSTIRLLHLHPGEPSDSVQVSVTTVSLDENPVYEAISYCWGNPREVHEIVCGGASLSPTVSLFSALVAFRLPDRTRVLWADAICIDQTNNDEKGHQVSLMPRIYSLATRVLIWLGPDEDGLEGVEKTVSEALEFLPPDTHDAAELSRQTEALVNDMLERQQKGQPGLLSHNWKPLASLLERPWFRRKWVVQETSLAREAIMYAGRIELPWNSVGLLSFKLESLGAIQLAVQTQQNREKVGDRGSNASDTQSRMPALIQKLIHNATVMLLIKHYSGMGTLFDCIVATVGFLCTDDRDHVYALLSLPGRPSGVVPDYKLSKDDVFQQFAAKEIAETQSLKLLGLAPDKLLFSRPRTPRLGIPSWVPDLRLLGEMDTLMSYNIREQLFHAGGLSKPIISFSGGGKVLQCQGREFDVVKVALPTYMEMCLSERPELWDSPIGGAPIDSSEASVQRIGRWAVDRYELAGRPFEAVPADAERSKAFTRTMLCGMTGMRDQPSADTIDAFPPLMEYYTDRAEGKTADYVKYPADKLKYVVSLENAVLGMAGGRKFCVTRDGRFGQLPYDAQIGDRLCVLVGAEVPFVVRPDGHGMYELIGECYVDGVMDGEALKASECTIEEIRFV